MAKAKKGKGKLRQQGMPSSNNLKKRSEKAPWDDPLANLARGGSRH